MDSQVYTDEYIRSVYETHWRTVWRVCRSFMKEPADAEDLVQETFLRFMGTQPVFRSEEHAKAWFIVTASNLCKDALRRRRRQAESIDEHPELTVQEDPAAARLTEALLGLPDRYKTEVYLHYYEGYTAAEIGALLRCPAATVRTRLARARNILKKEMGDDYNA